MQTSYEINQPENYDTIYANLPSLAHYPLIKDAATADKNMKAYQKQFRVGIGALYEHEDEYCTHDVWILVNSVVKYRGDMWTLTADENGENGIDVIL